MQIIAHIHTEFPTKFGVPRQSGLAGSLRGTIVFTPPYRNPDALRGIEGFSHIWLIWQFHKALREGFSPTVLPPKLGGKTRVGVFATRSPFRPNAIGLSSVRLLDVELHTPDGPVLHVAGADLVDGTPIFDIKPYLPYADCHMDATDAFAETRRDAPLQVVFPDEWLCMIPGDKREALFEVLALDTRPGYQHDPGRRYGFNYAGFDVRFTISSGILTVVEVVKL
ncbi:MAG: tRNA (N6-threonylcarbamoyladenosine(37)-N6)-methyltransferase TrmO, partial [Oscillospiraceae bacterium]